MHLLSLLIAPLQAVVLFFAPHASTAKVPSARMPARSLPSAHGLVPGSCAPTGSWAPGSLQAARVPYPRRNTAGFAKPIHPVRVVRNVDSSLPADRAGRMVVSGRFADVCAELDRLVAMETRAA